MGAQIATLIMKLSVAHHVENDIGKRSPDNCAKKYSTAIMSDRATDKAANDRTNDERYRSKRQGYYSWRYSQPNPDQDPDTNPMQLYSLSTVALRMRLAGHLRTGAFTRSLLAAALKEAPGSLSVGNVLRDLGVREV